MIKKIVLIGALLVFIGGAYFLRKNNQVVAPEVINRTQEKMAKVEKPKRNLNDAKIVGWFAYWDEKNSIESLRLAASELNSFTPVLYKIESDGSLGRWNVLNRSDVLDVAKSHNLAVRPQISDDFDHERVAKLLYDEQLQDEFIAKLVDEAKKEGFNGWDIDIESLKLEDKDPFSEFVENLARSLHKNNLKLSITVFAKNGKDNHIPAIAEDYKRIGRAADDVRLMVYQAHDEDTDPGGQAPLSYVREVMQYATKNIPKEKITIGLTTHGYDWANETAEPLVYRLIEQRIGEATASIRFDEKVSSAVFAYQKDDDDHVIWFEDSRAITEKMLIIMNEFDVDKFAIWRIGGEDPTLWEKLK